MNSELTPQLIAEWNAVKGQMPLHSQMPTQQQVVDWLKKIGQHALAALIGALSAAAFKKLMGW
jgi:hypothetical protein